MCQQPDRNRHHHPHIQHSHDHEHVHTHPHTHASPEEHDAPGLDARADDLGQFPERRYCNLPHGRGAAPSANANLFDLTR